MPKKVEIAKAAKAPGKHAAVQFMKNSGSKVGKGGGTMKGC